MSYSICKDRYFLLFNVEVTKGMIHNAIFLWQEDIDRFADVGSIDDNMESLLSHDGDDGRDFYGTLKHSPERQKESSKGKQ